MKIAFISDIHGNIDALKAVLANIEKQGIEQIYCVGDLVGYAPFPNEVIDLIQEKDIPTVMGNYDDGVGYDRFICGCDYKDEKAQQLGEQSILWTKKHTTEENKEFLRNLPKEIRINQEGYEVVITHGSPRRLNEYLYSTLPDDIFIECLNESKADVLILGHIHQTYHLEFSGRHAINVGSVGKPKHGNPKAVYAVVELGNTVVVDFNFVSYDVEKVAKAIEESELPNEFALALRKGRG